MDYYTILFYIFALLTVGSAVYVVTTKNIMHSAVSLFVTLFSIAALYVLLYADFIAVTQIMVYVGGILVLLIFGVMLTHKITEIELTTKNIHTVSGILFTVGITIVILFIIFTTKWPVRPAFETDSTISVIGNLLLTNYLLPFEIASVVLLIAIIGSAMYSRRK